MVGPPRTRPRLLRLEGSADSSRTLFKTIARGVRPQSGDASASFLPGSEESGELRPIGRFEIRTTSASEATRRDTEDLTDFRREPPSALRRGPMYDAALVRRRAQAELHGVDFIIGAAADRACPRGRLDRLGARWRELDLDQRRVRQSRRQARCRPAQTRAVRPSQDRLTARGGGTGGPKAGALGGESIDTSSLACHVKPRKPPVRERTDDAAASAAAAVVLRAPSTAEPFGWSAPVNEVLRLLPPRLALPLFVMAFWLPRRRGGV